jgi:hypothetical protein
LGKTIETVKEFFPNLSSVAIHTSTYSEQELCEVLSHVQVSNITYNGNSLHSYNNRIIQKAPIFYLKAKGETEFKAFYSERLLVYFHDHSGVKNINHDFVVLNSLTIFKGSNCRRVNIDEFYQIKLSEILKQAGISPEGKEPTSHIFNRHQRRIYLDLRCCIQLCTCYTGVPDRRRAN